MQTTVSGVGIFASSVLLAAIGFPRDAQPGVVDPLVVRHLGLVYAPLVIALYGSRSRSSRRIGSSRATHEANLRRLAGR